jgi:carbon monoxide dehydrogenase subunit G
MNVSGTRKFSSNPQSVWDVLNDPAELATLLPGVDTFDIQDERNWTATVKVPLGLGGLKLKFRFEKIEERPIERAALKATGKGVGAVISMETSFDLAPDGDGTSMDWAADVQVLGQIGGMGQRVLQPIVNQQVEQVMNALDERVQARAAG